MGNFDNQKMLAPNATLSPECNRVITKPNPLLMHLSKSIPILHRYQYPIRLDENPLLHANRNISFCWVQHVDKVSGSVNPGSHTLSVDQVNLKKFVQFHNQANPGSNKYLF